MQEIIDFLSRLAANNDRVWFNAHKDEYLMAKAKFEAFAMQVLSGIRGFDPTIGDLDIKQCTYRIYRDTRFSRDKRPYKTHFGFFAIPGGKKSGYMGYYFQIGVGEGYEGCFLAAGDYICERKIVEMLREDIDVDNGEEFLAALASAKTFEVDFSQALKRVPAGYPADKPYSQYLRLKNFCLVKLVAPDYFTEPGAAERLVADLATTRPFISFVNRPIAYEAEER
ncbi:MAG: DUF2461 domain-containing protein [Muribaculaceae bacterium]|nr:DUF2461 domain-containing protein [Muribaculaceae bacterium]